MLKIDTKKIKKVFKRTAWFLAKKAFLSFIIFIFFALFVGGAIFYYYAFLVMNRQPEVEIKSIQLDEELYQRFLEHYRQRRERFDEVDLEVYFNPFSTFKTQD